MLVYLKYLRLFFTIFLTMLLRSQKGNAQQAKHPFPQHVVYAKGVILPNQRSRLQLDSDVVMAYQRWRTNYLTEDIGKKGLYYIKYQPNPNKPVTVSEAHGYGMLVMAYMAGADKDAKTYYDGMFHFFKAHPSNGDHRMMNWQQAIKDGKVISVGGSSATDGDLDIAYSLLLADAQWGSAGQINYKAEAITLINALGESIVHGKFRTLKMGDWANKEGSRSADGTRPSDFMLQHLKAFKKVTGNKLWDTVATNTYQIINTIFKDYSANTGLLPDFAEYKEGRFIPAIGQLLEDKVDGSYSYNSARTPWRIATDYLVTGDTTAKKQLSTLNTWIKFSAKAQPELIRAGYQLDGKMLTGRDYQDLTYQAPFMVSAMIDQGNQSWLNSLWSHTVSHHDSYFGDSIAMLCLITASGNWWAP